MTDKRYIPTEIRKYLRQEVGYGCPIEGCRSPFLSYHHFDPKFSECQCHNKDKMIALCLEHHKKADVDTWSNDTLYSYKNAENRIPVNGQIDWDMHKSVILVGSNFFFGETFSFIIRDIEVFALKQKSDGKFYINAILLDEKCQILSEIRENDIILNPFAVEDFECTPSGSEIKIESICKATKIHLVFQRWSLDDFNPLVNRAIPDVKNILLESLESKLVDGKIMTISFFCMIKTNMFTVAAKEKRLFFDFTKSEIPNVKANLKGAVWSKNGLCINAENSKLLAFGEI